MDDTFSLIITRHWSFRKNLPSVRLLSKPWYVIPSRVPFPLTPNVRIQNIFAPPEEANTKLHFLKFIKPTWQESCVPFPAQTMLLVILDALYFIFRHSDSDRMGTFTCCATAARFPPSEVLPHPTTVPVFPEKSLSVEERIF